MYYLTAFGRRVRLGLKTPQCAAIAFAALSAGCSADVTRFDSTSFAFDDPPQSARQAPVPSEPVHAQGDYANPVARSTPSGPYGAGANNVEVAALPEATSSSGGLTEQSWQRSPRGVAATSPAPAYQPVADRSAPAADATVTGAIGSGRTIVVQPGDTLYRLSRTHGVSLSELMQANGLTSSDLKPGQQLVLPGSAASQTAYEPAQSQPPAAPVSLPVNRDVAANYNGTYTVKPGDSLYQIARAKNVNYAELQSVNNITDPRRVMPGTVLRVPAGTTVAAVEPARPATLTDAAPSIAAAPVEAPAAASPYSAPVNPSVRPSVLNAPKATTAPAAVAPKADKVAVAVPQAEAQAAGIDKLRWPVIGRVIGGFGGRPDGTHNDGINISVPLGSDVHAAESGVVAYAGSELKGYGNLILIRHDNGWVTAYAHNDELMVKRQDKVRRGQVIAKAGRTGTVDQPQLHFELRQGSRPVDPTPFMERL